MNACASSKYAPNSLRPRNRPARCLLALAISMVAAFVRADAPLTLELGNFTCPTLAVDWMREEIDQFAAAHPQYLVRTCALRHPARYRQPIELLPRLPNVFSVDSESGYETAYLAQRDLIRPVSHFLPDADFEMEAFPEGMWDSITWQGERWGVPWLAWTEILVCNNAILQAADIQRPPATWDELLDAAVRLTRDVDGDGKPDQWGLRMCSDDETLINVFVTLVMQEGGNLTQHGRFDLRSQAVTRAVARLHELIRTSGACYYDEEPLEDVLARNDAPFAMYLGHSRSLASAMNRADLRIAPLPGSRERGAATIRRLYLVVRRGSPEEEQASWEFIKWISRRDVSLPEIWGIGFPVRSDIPQREDFQETSRSRINDLDQLFAAQSEGREWCPQMRGRRKALQAVQDALEAIIFHGAAAEAALEQAEAQANTLATPVAVEVGDTAPEMTGPESVLQAWEAGLASGLTDAFLQAGAGTLDRSGDHLAAQLFEDHPGDPDIARWACLLRRVIRDEHGVTRGSGRNAQTLVTLWRAAEDSCAAVHQLDARALDNRLKEYTDSAEKLRQATDESALRLLRTINEAVFNRAWRLLGEYGCTFDDAGEISTRNDETVRRLLQLHTELLRAELRATAQSRAANWAAALDTAITFARRAGDRGLSVTLCTLPAGECPAAALAPAYLLRAALYARDDLEDTVLADALCQRLREQYPDSGEAPRAMLAVAQQSWRLGNHNEACLRAQELSAAYPASPEAADARYLEALCDEILGLDAQAETCMLALVNESPRSSAARAGLYWLAERALRHGRADDAASQLRRLLYLEKDTPLAGTAATLLARISAGPGQSGED